jgi:hypothetical protein
MKLTDNTILVTGAGPEIGQPIQPGAAAAVITRPSNGLAR